ncbi:hypothetical protein [Crossiella sp. CA198]|uniref:hypothetical protein n=1 Tax=Crossiella sp. CA198 TaxID=3455607 RepID=UPI003F8D6F6D
MKPGAITAWALLGLLSAITAVLASTAAALSAILSGIAQVGDAACVRIRTMPSAARPGLLAAGGQR